MSRLVIDRSIGAHLQSTIAHEFFHALARSHNSLGTLTTVQTATAAPQWERFWFVEASAVWAEHEFVPSGRRLADGQYEEFRNFQRSDLGLSTSNHSNEYASFAWPLFMRQELGPQAIADAWDWLEDKSDFPQLQTAVDRVLPFETEFREFAVRVLDQDLQPGDPLQPRFQVLDRDFPLELPTTPRASLGNRVVPGGRYSFTHELAPLWSRYAEFRVDPGVPQVSFDFSGMSPSVMLDVDLILKVKGQAWQRRSVTTGETKVCDVEKAYVVLANHDQRPTGKVSGTWVVEALRDPCPHTLVGQITSYLKTTFVDAEGNEWLQNEDNVTIHLEIATNEYGDFIAARGSTYHIVSTSGPFSGCREDTDQSGSIGLPEGSLPNPLADSAATAHASFGGGGTEAGSLILLEINVATNCGAWLGAFQFTLGADGIWRHDLVVPREPIAAGFVESESHGTMTGGP